MQLIIAKVIDWVSTVIILIAIIILIYVCGRVLICDQFVIPTNSMLPTLMPGDRIMVNKLVFGARIYKSYDFSDGAPLSSFRIPGIRNIKPNDVVVFNYPKSTGNISFKINCVYAKRCVGTPGDTVCASNGFFRNNNYDGIIGVAQEQQKLSQTPDDYMPDFVLHVAPFGYGWTIKNLGPLYVPRKGDTITIDSLNMLLYRDIIEYETRATFNTEGAKGVSYCFEQNYYFMCGDNVSDSGDSRYWGFVPEEFIIGVAQIVTYSSHRENGTVRWGRFLKLIE